MATETTTQTVERVLNQLAQVTARRVARTGETFEVATERVLTDFAAEWPELATRLVALAR